MTDTLKLKSLIVAAGMTQEKLAEQLGISKTTLNYKLNNKKDFKASEIKKISEILGMADELNSIFFN